MKTPKRATSFVPIAMTVAFGVLMAVVAVVAVKGDAFELRSRAAQEEVEAGRWAFDTNAEGWVAYDVQNSGVTGGAFRFTTHQSVGVNSTRRVCGGPNNTQCRTQNVQRPYIPRLVLENADITLRQLSNKIKIRMNITPSTSNNRGGASQPVQNQGVQSFQTQVNIAYKLAGRDSYETPVNITVSADGSEHEYTVPVPNAHALRRIVSVKIGFDMLRSYPQTTVYVNEISFIGVRQMNPVSTRASVPRVSTPGIPPPRD